MKTEEYDNIKKENRKFIEEIKENNSLHSNEKSNLVQGLEFKNNNLEKDVTKLKGTLDVSTYHLIYINI